MRRRTTKDDLLTPREREVLELLREGLTNEQIAQRLGVSFATAKYHVGEILSKLGVSSREEAARWQPEVDLERRQGRWGLFPALGKTWLLKAGKTATASVIVAGLVATALVLFDWIQKGSSADGIDVTSPSGFGVDLNSESIRLFEQARLSTPYKHTVLFSKGMPANVGTEADLIASLPRVETLEELHSVMTQEINLIVVDQSAVAELEGTDFIYEQWEGGRGIIGLNVCFADLPTSKLPDNPQGSTVREVSPSGEVRYYDTSDRPDEASRCSWALQIAAAGYPYVSYVPARPTLDEIEEMRERGEDLIFQGGGTGRLDLPSGADCYVRDLLAYLDAGGYRPFRQADCD